MDEEASDQCHEPKDEPKDEPNPQSTTGPCSISPGMHDIGVIKSGQPAESLLFYDGKNYACALCNPAKFKPTKKSKVLKHLQFSHEKHGVSWSEFTILPCFNLCQLDSSRAHYHCPVCKHAIARKLSFEKHLKTHLVNSSIKVKGKNAITRLQKIVCGECGLAVAHRNYNRHTHVHANDTIGPYHHGICVDGENGLFMIARSRKGPRHPIHVTKKTVGSVQKIMCEVAECRDLMAAAARNMNPGYECCHLMSVTHAAPLPSTTQLRQEMLDHLTDDKKMFSNHKRTECVNLKRAAIDAGSPLIVPWLTPSNETETYLWFSVHTNKQEYWCKFGRTVVTYNTTTGKWSCQCGIRLCVHQSIALWFLYGEYPQKLELTNDEIKQNIDGNVDAKEPIDSGAICYPPTGTLLETMLLYIRQSKKIPINLEITKQTYSENMTFIPKETVCEMCPEHPDLSSPIALTHNAKVIHLLGVSGKATTYIKYCPICKLTYRYQEYTDGVINFNDTMLLDLHLCVFLRHHIQHHVAVGRVRTTIEDIAGIKINKQLFFNAYMFFEALSEHAYKFFCIRCGHHPPILVLDGHRKGAFSLNIENLETTENQSDTVHVTNFWTKVENEILLRGLTREYKTDDQKSVKPSYSFWAPWIGEFTRKDEFCYNTEFMKTYSFGAEQNSENLDMAEISADRLLHMIKQATLKEVKLTAKKMKIPSKRLTTKRDIIVEIKKQLDANIEFDKTFTQIWGASGGWVSATCPHGVVYCFKSILRAEGARDHVDLLLSLKHQPTIIICDFPHVVAAHGNKRKPGMFQPHEGRLCEVNEGNLSAAKDGTLRVLFPWLQDCSVSEPTDDITNTDTQGKMIHPVTKQSETYALYDRFHERNTKRQQEILRRVVFVPELRGMVNTQIQEQLYSFAVKSNYFLDVMNCTNHIFMLRCILDMKNEALNSKFFKSLSSIFSVSMCFDAAGRVEPKVRAIASKTQHPIAISGRTGRPFPSKNTIPKMTCPFCDKQLSKTEFATHFKCHLFRLGITSQISSAMLLTDRSVKNTTRLSQLLIKLPESSLTHKSTLMDVLQALLHENTLSEEEEIHIEENLKYIDNVLGYEHIVPNLNEGRYHGHSYQLQGCTNLCGLCALNNAIGKTKDGNYHFTATDFNIIADDLWVNQLLELNLPLKDKLDQFRSQMGDYSMEVLIEAAKRVSCGLKPINTVLDTLQHDLDYQFVVRLKEIDHIIAIRKISAERYVLLDSRIVMTKFLSIDECSLFLKKQQGPNNQGTCTGSVYMLESSNHSILRNNSVGCTEWHASSAAEMSTFTPRPVARTDFQEQQKDTMPLPSKGSLRSKAERQVLYNNGYCASSFCNYPSGDAIDWAVCPVCKDYLHTDCIGVTPGDICPANFVCSVCQPVPVSLNAEMFCDFKTEILNLKNYLELIVRTKVFSRRYRAFHKPSLRPGLIHLAPLPFLEDDEYHSILALVTNWAKQWLQYSSHSSEPLKLSMDVLLPEAIIRFIMKKKNVQRDQAEYLYLRTRFQRM